MKRTFTLFAALIAFVCTVSAQRVVVYQGDSVAASYDASKVDSIVFQKTVTFTCWIDSVCSERWEETAVDLGNGTYRFDNFMNAGYPLLFNIDPTDSTLTISFPDGVLYPYEVSYGTLLYWYTEADDTYHSLYPYGKDASTYLTDLVLLNGASYNKYFPSRKYGYFYVEEAQTNTMTAPAYWQWFCFTIKE